MKKNVVKKSKDKKIIFREDRLKKGLEPKCKQKTIQVKW